MKKIILILLLMPFLPIYNVYAKSASDLEVENFVSEYSSVIEQWENYKIKKGEKLYGKDHIEIG